MKTHPARQLGSILIGFDQIMKSIIAQKIETPSFPKYNLISNSDTEKTIEIALAGYSQSDIEIIHQKNSLTIKSDSQEKDDNLNYLHKGVAKRAFSLDFHLAEFIFIKGATMENGMLCISLELKVPEEDAPVKIQIN